MKTYLDNRWAIAIDLEGFSNTFSSDRRQALRRLGVLMEGICKIAETYSAPESNRFFAHQISDGFLIVSDFGATTFETPIAFATVLLRYLAINDAVGKAFIAEGEFGSFGGCYPDCIREKADENWHVRIGESHLFIFDVMGMALIRAYKGLARAPSGSLLLVDKCNEKKIPEAISTIQVAEGTERRCISINWLDLDTNYLRELSARAGLEVGDKDNVRAGLTRYLLENKRELSHEWVKNTMRHLRLE